MERKPTKEELMKEFAPLKKAVDARRLPKNDNTQDKVNKTVVDRARQNKDEESAEEVQEFKMIVAMAVSKKKQNFNQLKRWDEKRSEILAAHRNVIDELQLELDKRIKASLENIEAYCSFFREKAKQEERYGQHSIIDPRLTTQQNPIALQVYINCTSLLNVLGEHSQKEGERMQKFATIIKNDILKDRLEEHHSRSIGQGNLLKIRERISLLKSSLQKLNTETENNSKQLATFYSEHIQSVNCFTSDRDFLKDQLSFLTKADEQTKVQKRLGQACFDYLKAAQEQQQKRQAVVREAIFIYVDAMNQAYGTKFQQPQLDQMRKKQQQAQASKLFSLEEILHSRTIQFLKDKMNSSKLNNKILSDFLDKLVFQDFDTRNLILKQYSLVRQVNKQLHEQCSLVITVDGFIHIFYLRSYAYAKPDCSYKINQQLSLKSLSDLKMEIGRKNDKRRSGMMSFLAWDTKVEAAMVLRFAKKDAKQEMLDFMRKMM